LLRQIHLKIFSDNERLRPLFPRGETVTGGGGTREGEEGGRKKGRGAVGGAYHRLREGKLSGADQNLKEGREREETEFTESKGAQKMKDKCLKKKKGRKNTWEVSFT